MVSHGGQRRRLLGRHQQVQLLDRVQPHRGHQFPGTDDVLAGDVGHRDLGHLGAGRLPGLLGGRFIGEQVRLQRGGHQVGHTTLRGQALLIGQVA